MPTTDRTEEELRRTVLELEDRRYSAMLAGDADAIAGLLDENLVYIHSGGVVETKDGYVKTLGSGYVEYLAIEHPVEKTIVVGDVVIVFGTMAASVRVGGEPRELASVCIAVWRTDGDEPRLVTLQATSTAPH